MQGACLWDVSNLRDELIVSYDSLRRTAARWSGDLVLAEDLVQTVAVTVLQIPQREIGEARAYLFGILWQTLIRHWRDARRARRGAPRWHEKLNLIAEAAADPSAAESRDELVQAVEQLPRSLRDVVTLQLEGFAPSEISDELSKTATSVRVQSAKARRLLRMALAPEVAALASLQQSPEERSYAIRQIAELRYSKRLTLREISRVTGFPSGTVSSYLSEAKRQGLDSQWRESNERREERQAGDRDAVPDGDGAAEDGGGADGRQRKRAAG